MLCGLHGMLAFPALLVYICGFKGFIVESAFTSFLPSCSIYYRGYVQCSVLRCIFYPSRECIPCVVRYFGMSLYEVLLQPRVLYVKAYSWYLRYVVCMIMEVMVSCLTRFIMSFHFLKFCFCSYDFRCFDLFAQLCDSIILEVFGPKCFVSCFLRTCHFYIDV